MIVIRFFKSRDTVSELKKLPPVVSHAVNAIIDITRIQSVANICETREERKRVAQSIANETV